MPAITMPIKMMVLAMFVPKEICAMLSEFQPASSIVSLYVAVRNIKGSVVSLCV